MKYGRHYPPKYLAALEALENAECNGGIAQGPKKSYLGRPTWWTYIDGIELNTPLVDIYDKKGSLNFIELPKSLRSFLADTCQGNIDAAIIGIDKITKSVAFMVDISEEWELLDHLQMTGTFLRDVSAIVFRSKHRPERYADHEDYLPPPSNEIVDALHTDSAKVVSSQLREFSQVKRAVMDKRPTGPRKPNFILAGFCLVCHRVCCRKDFYCQTHCRSLGQDSDIKASRRMINNAFKNLNMKLPFERTVNTEGLTQIEIEKAIKDRQKELNITTEKAFHDRCHTLEGWAKHRPEHKLFYSKIDSLLESHPGYDSCNSWEEVHLEMFKKIIPVIKSIEHMSSTFHPSFFTGNAPKVLCINLLNQVFKISTSIEVSPSQAVTMLYRMSQINLIKMASTKSGLKSLNKVHAISSN